MEGRTMERRYLNQAASSVGLDVRAEGEAAIVGHAAVYYDGTDATEYKLWDGAVERIMPGTFDKAIKDNDVRALFNHDPNNLLGRTSADTLTLESDKRGLAYEITPGDTSIGNDVVTHIQRGDLQGSSFAFVVTDQDWRTEDSVDIREIRGVELFDVGPVTFPAYEATDTGLRSSGDAREAYEAWKAVEDNKTQSAQLQRQMDAKKFDIEHPVKNV